MGGKPFSGSHKENETPERPKKLDEISRTRTAVDMAKVGK